VAREKDKRSEKTKSYEGYGILVVPIVKGPEMKKLMASLMAKDGSLRKPGCGDCTMGDDESGWSWCHYMAPKKSTQLILRKVL